MALIAEVIREMQSLAASADSQQAMGLDSESVNKFKRNCVDTITSKLQLTKRFNADDHSEFLKAVAEVQPMFGNIHIASIADAANARLAAPTAPARSRTKGQHTGFSHCEEPPQDILHPLSYFSEFDWAKFNDAKLCFSTKLYVVGKRLNEWNVKHLSEESRRVIVGMLAGVHWGYQALGKSVKYRTLYNRATELAKIVIDGYGSAKCAGTYVVKYPPLPTELPKTIQDRLMLESGDSLVTATMPDLDQCMAKVPIRSNNKLLQLEDRDDHRSGPSAERDATGYKRGRSDAVDGPLQLSDVRDMFASLLDQRFNQSKPTPVGGWKPANNFQPLCDGSAESNADTNNSNEDRTSPWAPKLRQFGTATAAGAAPPIEGSASTPGGHGIDADAKALGEAGAGAAAAATKRMSVEDYEKAVIAHLDSKKEKAVAKAKAKAKGKAVEASKSTLKKPAGHGGVGRPPVGKGDVCKPSAVRASAFKVNIKSICVKNMIKNSTINGFKRRGYDLGAAQAKAHGFNKDSREYDAARREGYRLATAFWEKNA